MRLHEQFSIVVTESHAEMSYDDTGTSVGAGQTMSPYCWWRSATGWYLISCTQTQNYSGPSVVWQSVKGEYNHSLNIWHQLEATFSATPGGNTNKSCAFTGTLPILWYTTCDGASWGTGSTLIQYFWRGNQGWMRTVPIISGSPDFNQASSWSGPVAISTLPGTGDMQAESNVIIGSTLYQEIWRSDTRWTRTVPVVGGVIQWGSATSWVSGTTNFGNVGSGTVQVRNDYVIGYTLYQGFWRGAQGWSRTVPISSGTPQWGQASSWSGPYSYSGVGLPGTGDIQTLSIYPIGTNLRQGVWRNNYGYSRIIPIIHGVPDWNQASGWSSPISISSLPGSGNMQAQDNYDIP